MEPPPFQLDTGPPNQGSSTQRTQNIFGQAHPVSTPSFSHQQLQNQVIVSCNNILLTRVV
jgi:hypothetical protein